MATLIEWLGELFHALPRVAVALWTFGDGFVGVIVSAASALLTAGFVLLAMRTRDSNGWLSALAGTMAATIAAFWVFGILPSAWVYFVDAQRDLLEGTVIPASLAIPEIPALGTPRLEIAMNFLQVVRDSIVMVETTVAMLAFAVLAVLVQKRYPRGLAEGEERGSTSGGYK